MKSVMAVGLAVLCCCVAACSIKKPSPGNARFVGAAAFKSLVDAHAPDTVLLDIRTPEEYAGGHIAGALNMDFYNPEFSTRIAALDAAKNYLIYCRSGNRTRLTAAMLAARGFKNVVILEHGINDWVANKMPLVR